MAALARATEAGFSEDGRVGPWVSVLRSDAEFAAHYVDLDADRYQTIVAGMCRLLFDRDTVPGAEPEDLLGAGHSGADRAGAGQLARAVGGALPTGVPARSDYWDVPVAEQTAETAPARVIEFLESLTL